MEPDPWEWQPARYASVAIPHKAMRQGRGAARPPTPSAFHPTSVKRRYTLLRVSPLFLFISLSYICILCVPLPLSPFLQGIKSNLRLFFKDIVKAIQPGKKVHFLPEDISLPSQPDFNRSHSPLWGFLLTYELNDLYIGKKTIYLCFCHWHLSRF